MTDRLNHYTADELRRLVDAQKREIHRLQDSMNESRDIAKQLLFELRQHVETPATHADYWWLRDDTPSTDTQDERHPWLEETDD